MVSRTTPDKIGEPLLLAFAIVLFAGLAALASGPAEAARTASRESARSGPLAVEATLSQGALLRGGDGSLLLHVRLKGAPAPALNPIDLALVLDVDTRGTGESNLALLSRACLEVSRQLGPEDRITVVSFADEARTVLAPGQSLQPLVAGRGRNFSAALERAADELRRAARRGAMRRILVVATGVPDAGVTDGDALRALVARFAGEGISLSTLGVGESYDPIFMKSLSDAGGGSYHGVDAPERLVGIYAAELRSLRSLVARDVRVTLTPAPGVEIEEVIEWPTSREGDATTVLVGDFEGLRTAKVVARVRVKDPAAATDVVSVALGAVEPGSRSELPAVCARVGVTVTPEKDAVLASVARGLIERDLEDARVVSCLRRSEEAARRRDVSGVRESLELLRTVRPLLEYQAADGQVERRSVDEIEAELVWLATRKDEEKGTLAALVEGAKEKLDSVWPVQARKHGNEASAIGALKTIATSQALFREGDKEQDGNLDYATLAELDRTKLIDSVLGSGTKQGYQFEVHPVPGTPEFLWYAVARPTAPGTTGERYFYTNQAGVIFYSMTPIEVDPATGQARSQRWDTRAQKFVEAYVIPTGK